MVGLCIFHSSFLCIIFINILFLIKCPVHLRSIIFPKISVTSFFSFTLFSTWMLVYLGFRLVINWLRDYLLAFYSGNVHKLINYYKINIVTKLLIINNYDICLEQFAVEQTTIHCANRVLAPYLLTNEYESTNCKTDDELAN